MSTKRYVRFIYKTIRKVLIELSVIKKATFVIKQKKIEFHDIHKSALLKQIALNGYDSYESELVMLIKNYNWKVDIFIDAGANVGFYSVLAELFFPQSTHIIAVEPFPLNIKYLEKLKSRNKLKFSLLDKAINNSNGKIIDLYFPTSSTSSELSSSASLINSFKGTNGIFQHLSYESVQVKTVTLSDIIGDQHDNILIKLDCEGNELNILKSSETLLAKDRIDFIVESGINDQSKDELFSIMSSFGYKAFLITNSGLVREDRLLTFPYPWRKNRTIWKNHLFTKRDISEIKEFSLRNYGYWI